MSNNNAIVWGASGGIGRAMSEQLIQRGWRVIAVSRHEDRHPDGTAVDIEISSVADPFALQQAVMEAGYEIERASLFVYAVGDIAAAPVGEMDQEKWRQIMEANLTGAYMTAHHSLPLLSEDAALVFIGAIHERLRMPGLTAYAAAKAGLEAFADALKKEERKKRVLVVRPGAVDTPLWEKVPMNLPKNAMNAGQAAERILNQALDEGGQGTVDIT